MRVGRTCFGAVCFCCVRFSLSVGSDVFSACVNSDGEAHAGDVPKFHYEVHHVTHQFGHRTPADVKLRQVARHAASSTISDDDDDDTPPPPPLSLIHI